MSAGEENTNQTFSLHKACLFNLILFIYLDGAGQWPTYCHYFFMSRTGVAHKAERIGSEASGN